MLTMERTRALVAPLDAEGPRRHWPICWVGKGTGEGTLRCTREATVAVYGIAMCAEHGAEAESGALEEVSDALADEVDALLMRYPGGSEATAALARALTDLRGVTGRAEDATDLSLVAAYPHDKARVDPETPAHREDFAGPTPYDDYRDRRVLVHKLMRLAYSAGDTALVEQLEVTRERNAEQLAYAAHLMG